MEAAMMLDDVYGSDFDESFLRQEAEWHDRTPPELEWDESEASLVINEMLSATRSHSHEFH